MQLQGFVRWVVLTPVLLPAATAIAASRPVPRHQLGGDAGCRETKVENMRQRLAPAPSATVTFGVNALSCADGDFYLTGIADPKFDRVEGQCNVVGNNPNCRFTMIRE